MYLNNLNKFLKFYKIVGFFKRFNSSSIELNVIKSKSSTVTIPNQFINEYIWQNCDKWYNKTAVICFETGRYYTFGELKNKSQILACNLKYKLNVKDTVAVIVPNIIEFPIVFLGAIQAGLLVTTVNPVYTADEIATQLKDSEATLIFTIPKLLPTIKKSLQILSKHLTIIAINERQNDELPTGVIKLSELLDNNHILDKVSLDQSNNQSPNDVAILPYSSGTTGLNKGVQLTHRNVVANLCQMSSPDFSIHRTTKDYVQDIVPIFLPLFHIYGLVAVFLNFLSKGCKLVVVPQFIPAQFKRLLETYKPTLLFAVPQIIAYILHNNKLQYEDLKSIRTIVSAAAPLSAAAVEQFNDKTRGVIKLLQIYGMTETSPLTLMQSGSLEQGMKIGGAGYLIPNTEAKIVSLDSGEMKGLPFGKTGELLIHGPQVMKGYHNNPLATQDAFEGKWLRTGDVGYYDEDQHFFITDRLKELIKVKGFQVAPAELEEVLRTHPSVFDVAVVGVPHRVQGEAPKAFVVLKRDTQTKPDELKEFVAKKVSNYKHLIGGVVIMEKIPRNYAGKVLRRELRGL